MGVKATKYLFHQIFFWVIIVFAAAGVVGSFTVNTDPSESIFITLTGLVMLPITVVIFIGFLYLAFRRSLWAIIPLCVLILNYSFIKREFRLSLGSDERGTVCVATYNIHYFSHNKDFGQSVSEVADFLRDQNVGVACFQEFTTSKKFPLDSIQKVFNFMPYCRVSIPEGAEVPNLAIFSRYPIKQSGSIFFEMTPNSAMWIDVDIEGTPVRVFNNHLQTTNINQSGREIAQLKSGNFDQQEAEALSTLRRRLSNNYIMRAAQARKVRSVIDTTSTPVIVCGDFNDTPASYTYGVMSRELVDGFVESGSGYAYTYRKMMRSLRIDYIFYTDFFEGIRYYSPNMDFSDHKPVLVDLTLRD